MNQNVENGRRRERLLRDAVRMVARRAAEGATEVVDGVVAAPANPTRPRRPMYIERSARNEDGTVAWDRHLAEYLKPVRNVTLEWGLVDDWNVPGDGAVTKRRGVIVRVAIDITKAILQEDWRVGYREEKLQTILQAIDMIHFLVALKPADLEMKLFHGSGEYGSALEALTRGEPWEVKVNFTYTSTDTAILQRRFIQDLLGRYDTFASYHEFAGDRFDLLQVLVRIESPRLERLAQLANHSIVRAEMVFVVNDMKRSSVLGSEDFFEFLLVFITHLNRHQTWRTSSPRLWNKHAPFHINNITLLLDRVHITSQVCRHAKALGKARIPVQLGRLGLDIRLIGCSEADFREFIQTITAGTNTLAVGTGLHDTKESESMGFDDRDRSKQIRSFLGVIAEIQSLHTLSVDGILGMCSSAVNREAVWRGLFESVLSPDTTSNLRKFRKSRIHRSLLLKQTLSLKQAQFIAESAAQWRNANPREKLRLSKLDLRFHTADMSAVRALLSNFDDVEEVSLLFPVESRREAPLRLQELSSEDILPILHYPSLHRIYLSGVSIPSMDLFNPSIHDPRLPIKPVLRNLGLSRFQMTDRMSLTRFLDNLKHTSGAPSQLEKKLQVLEVNWIGSSHIVDLLVLATLDEVLTTNETFHSVVFLVNFENSEGTDVGRKLARKYTGRIILGSDARSVKVKASKIEARVEVEESSLVDWASWSA